jgi:hypothetical protein
LIQNNINKLKLYGKVRPPKAMRSNTVRLLS